MKKFSKGNVPLSKTTNKFFDLITSKDYEIPKNETDLKDHYNRMKELIEVNRTYHTTKINYNDIILKYMKEIDDELKNRKVSTDHFQNMENFQKEIDLQMDLRTQIESAKGIKNIDLLKKRIQKSARKCKIFDTLLIENERRRDSKFLAFLKQKENGLS